MKFVLASYGTRGDVEPCAALGRELLGRGHDVRMAVAPDLVGFAEAAGLAAVAYGLETRDILGAYRDFWMSFCAGCGANFGSPYPGAGGR
jgi:UDP:flavonoid glycosyltransferase YjiC (YdhE family)